MADQLIERYQKQPCFIGYNNVMTDECCNAYANVDIVSTEYSPLVNGLQRVV